MQSQMLISTRHASIFRIHNNAGVWLARPAQCRIPIYFTSCDDGPPWTQPPCAPLREDMMYGDKVATTAAGIIYPAVTLSTAIRSIDSMQTTSVIFD